MRSAWTFAPGLVFLNHGSFGACPRDVLSTQQRYREELERDPVHFLLRQLPPLLEAARSEVAAFIGAPAENLAFVPNTTTGVNTVLRSLALEPGDALLTTNHVYAACHNALAFVAERAGADIIVADVPFPIAQPEEVVARITERVTERVRLALIDHVTSTTGLVLPIAEIVGALRARGVETLVDGAHAAGMLPLRVREIGAAYYVTNLHKWVCAPKGAAALVVRDDLRDTVHPLVISHGYRASGPRPRFLEEFDWTGTDDPSAWLSAPAALRCIASLVPDGWDGVRQRNRDLALSARKLLCEALGVDPPAPQSMIGSLATVPLPRLVLRARPAADARRELPASASAGGLDALSDVLYERYNIEVPVFFWPQAPDRFVRISAHLYNTLDEYQRLADALVSELAG